MKTSRLFFQVINSNYSLVFQLIARPANREGEYSAADFWQIFSTRFSKDLGVFVEQLLVMIFFKGVGQ